MGGVSDHWPSGVFALSPRALPWAIICRAVGAWGLPRPRFRINPYLVPLLRECSTENGYPSKAGGCPSRFLIPHCCRELIRGHGGIRRMRTEGRKQVEGRTSRCL